jgi:hypothetical protein
MKMFKTLVVVWFSMMISACANHKLGDHSEQTPTFDLVEFFEGKSVAHGQFQDRFGKVRRRFSVDIEGSWDGEELTLIEDFFYDDGEEERRVWRIRKGEAENSWTGYADGVVGHAQGEVAGNAMHWRYEFDLATGPGKTMRVSFDDWLWLQTPDRLLNKAYVSRLGVDIGEVTIFFERGDSI